MTNQIIPSGFSSLKFSANGTSIHYVKGGTGPLVILIHGWPQDWSEYQAIMPRLAERFTVVSVDLRGIGQSEATESGYEAANLAKDIHELVFTLGNGKSYLAGHDIGGGVAHAYARLFPDEVRGLMVIEAPLAGIDPWKRLVTDPKMWHMHFYQATRIPELLIGGRVAPYFREFFNTGPMNPHSMTESDVARYASAYDSPSQLRAGLEIYRAFPANEEFNTMQKGQTEIPVLLVAGEESFAPILAPMAAALQSNGWANVDVKILPANKHYILDEKPQLIAELIEERASV